jgi:hypothetical protein
MDTLVSYFQTRTASRKHREEALEFVKNSSEIQTALLQLAFNPKAERQHIYAAWIWELFILEDSTRLRPHLPRCIAQLTAITNSSMRRSLSKSFWCFLKEKSNREVLNKKEKQQLVDSLLDWVMTEDKTAPLAFSIKILSLFQNEISGLKVQLKALLIDSHRTFPKGVSPVLRDVFKN